jgi:hypothetical protein
MEITGREIMGIPTYGDQAVEITQLSAEIARLKSINAELLTALKKAKETIHIWHGNVAWDLYQKSPEMKIINEALAKEEK